MAAVVSLRTSVLTHASLRLLLSWLCFNAVALLWGPAIGHRLIPLYRAVLSLWVIDYHVESLRIDQVAGESVFQLVVTTRNAYHVGAQTVSAGMEVSSSTLLAHAFQPLIVLVCLLALWPASSWRSRMMLALIATALALIFMLFDVPIVLLGALDALIQTSLHSATATGGFSVWWMNAMNGGGRLALPMVAVLLSATALRVGQQTIFKK